MAYVGDGRRRRFKRRALYRARNDPVRGGRLHVMKGCGVLIIMPIYRFENTASDDRIDYIFDPPENSQEEVRRRVCARPR